MVISPLEKQLEGPKTSKSSFTNEHVIIVIVWVDRIHAFKFNTFFDLSKTQLIKNLFAGRIVLLLFASIESMPFKFNTFLLFLELREPTD